MTFIIGQKPEPIFEISKREYPLRKLKTISRYDGFVACRVANAALVYTAALFDRTSDRKLVKQVSFMEALKEAAYGGARGGGGKILSREEIMASDYLYREGNFSQ